ncbi:unnamed protein product [Notodromas monacha]|uniref:Spliceosome-associated protein CWC15 homolog n=1 Tax=Notodromas monacha TaxID=399045 RepID=A0A7R9GEW6_9CRUS|nr:unnamed protein product [Notodromas monacha]CAG0918682.1 unnamed protein product [Notodromas monacha]
MTTAARPTFDPARGGSGKGETDLSALSKQYSSRDLPGHTKLKFRETGQGTVDELRSKDFRRDLEERESKTKRSASRRSLATEERTEPSSKKPRTELPIQDVDADDPIENDDEDSDADSDDEAELMAELQRIKKERANDIARKEIEKKQEEGRIRTENILSGNPLLQERMALAAGTGKADFRVRRRWDDDVVFKNCARGQLDNPTNRFINDSLRSDFHRKFMEKYIK